MRTRRRFRHEDGSTGCYSFNITKGVRFLLRAYFYFDVSSPGETAFDLHLGVNYWTTVNSSTGGWQYAEIILAATSNHIHLCFVDTGHGDPFINYLELRTFSGNIYNATSMGSLQQGTGERSRYSFADITQSIRFPDDRFDRIWDVQRMPPAVTGIYGVNTSEAVPPNLNVNDEYCPPWKVLRRAFTPINNISMITIGFNNNQPRNTTFYVLLHFAELVQGVQRPMNVTLCTPALRVTAQCQGEVGISAPSYLQASTYPIMFTVTQDASRLNLNIWVQDSGAPPPSLNAYEVYRIIPFELAETNEGDVVAITAIKNYFRDAIKAKGWQWIADPCLPQNQTWTGITCAYNASEPPRVTQLNLSSCGLSGAIPQAIANFTMLERLDLSFNNLSGTVPGFLLHLQNLTFISFEGNKMTGSWPSALLEKQKNGLIELRGKFQGAHRNIGVIIAISISILGALICLSLVVFFVLKSKYKYPPRESPKSTERIGSSIISSKLRRFKPSEVNDLIHDKRVLGKGGFGTVYLCLMDGSYVAVKILDGCSEQSARQFKSEVQILATVYHKNLTRIIGYCNGKTTRAVVMEFVENRTLEHHLSAENPVLSWEKRASIIIGAAQGLEYLHHGCRPPIIHRDIKPANILLTEDFEPKLADFGLSRLFTSQYMASTIVGTLGYLDPLRHEEAFEKLDIYSFGVVLLVVVTGRRPILPERRHLSHWVKENIERGNIHAIIDPRLDGNYNEIMAWVIVEMALICISRDLSMRPSMEDIVKNLKSAMAQCAESSQGISLSIGGASDILGPKAR